MLEPLYFGALGAGLILMAFVLGQLHVWKDIYFIYDAVNFLGSGLLVYYAWTGASWPFFILNTVWAAVSLRDGLTDLQRNARKGKSMGSWEKWMH